MDMDEMVHKFEGMMERISTEADRDEVRPPGQELDQLRHVIDHVRRGEGAFVLFEGASGTGKTMATKVVASALGMDLYRVDLASVVNKYIGETEKNLATLLDAAEKANVILLFDEADALFGKRGRVKDSHDRYANIEVSFLLQRMESYEGLAILTTNMKEALDPAFLRRIRFIVGFPYPDKVARKRVWQGRMKR
jgi:SpoVK/Ycf46/Vps4 family AAA+-type ATPase